jgi:hypothetical protein
MSGRKGNQPKELWIILDTKSIEVVVWHEGTVAGNDTLRFSLSHRGDGRQKRSFKPAHLLDLPHALVKLAKKLAFANWSNVDAELRPKFARLASVLEQAISTEPDFDFAVNAKRPTRRDRK